MDHQVEEDRPFYEVIDELDEILEETNRQVDSNECTRCDHDEHYYFNHREPNNPCGAEGCPCTQYLPYRVVEKAVESDNQYLRGECLERGHLWVKYGKVGLTDKGLSGLEWGPVICLRCGEPCETCGGQAFDPDEWPKGVAQCPGCNLRDLTMNDAKRHIRDLLIEAPNTHVSRAAAQWLRLDGKIHAAKEED